MTEYEIKDIKLSKDGAHFRVIVNSRFITDEFGEPKDEMFQFPISDLDNQDKWHRQIESIMINRHLAEIEEQEKNPKIKNLSGYDKKIHRLKKLQKAKKDFVKVFDISEKLNKKLEIRKLEQKAKSSEPTKR